jgi:hypothetical protein
MKNKVLLENIVAKVPKSLLLIDKSDLPAFCEPRSVGRYLQSAG